MVIARRISWLLTLSVLKQNAKGAPLFKYYMYRVLLYLVSSQPGNKPLQISTNVVPMHMRLIAMQVKSISCFAMPEHSRLQMEAFRKWLTKMASDDVRSNGRYRPFDVDSFIRPVPLIHVPEGFPENFLLLPQPEPWDEIIEEFQMKWYDDNPGVQAFGLRGQGSAPSAQTLGSAPSITIGGRDPAELGLAGALTVGSAPSQLTSGSAPSTATIEVVPNKKARLSEVENFLPQSGLIAVPLQVARRFQHWNGLDEMLSEDWEAKLRYIVTVEKCDTITSLVNKVDAGVDMEHTLVTDQWFHLDW